MSSRMSQSDEMEEIIFYITEMRRKVNSKMDDFFFIIEQQNKRIHEQNTVIDELAWQLRDLRDSVREINSRRDHCPCNYENHVPSIKNSIRLKLGQNSKNNLNKFADHNNIDHFDDAEGDEDDGGQTNSISNYTKNVEKTVDDCYEPIEFNNNFTPRMSNHKHQEQQTSNGNNNNINNSNNSNSNNNRASLNKLLNNENNYDNKMKKVQYSKSCTNVNDFDQGNGFRKERNKVRDVQSELFAKSNISVAEEEMNDDVILRRQTVVIPKSNRSSYRGSNNGISSIMSDIEEESISDMMDKLKHEPRGINYSRQKMRPSSFKTSF